MEVVPDVRVCVAGIAAWELSTLPFPCVRGGHHMKIDWRLDKIKIKNLAARVLTR
jgi:hypothetical protein